MRAGDHRHEARSERSIGLSRTARSHLAHPTEIQVMPTGIVRLLASELVVPGWRQRLEDALDECAEAVVVIDGLEADWSAIDATHVRSIAAVTLAVVRDAGPKPPPASAACDLCACVGDAGGEAWQWAGLSAELDGWIESLANRVRTSPLAVTALARTLRLTERLSIQDGLVVESLAYSVLQAGPEHQRWLANRNSPRPKQTP